MVDGDELLQRGVGVLALRGQDDDVVVADCDSTRIIDNVGPDGDPLSPGLQLQPVRAHRVVVRTTRDEDDVVAVLVEPPADRPADRPGTVNEEAHRQLETRLRHPSMRRLAIDMFGGNTGASSAVNQWASAISVPSTVISPDTYRAPKPIMSWCGNGHG
jgi:hypothetical protein